MEITTEEVIEYFFTKTKKLDFIFVSIQLVYSNLLSSLLLFSNKESYQNINFYVPCSTHIALVISIHTMYD